MSGKVERKENTTVFHWTLEPFSSLGDRVDSSCFSPSFSFEGRSWGLRLYPNGRWNQSKGDVLLGLYACDSEPARDVRYSVGIRTARGTKVCGSGTGTFHRPSSPDWVRLVKRSELFRQRDELLPLDTLTLTVELKLGDGSSETVPNVADASVQATVERNVADATVQATVEESLACGGKGEPSEKTGPEKIVEDVGKLWPNGDHTDVILKVKNAEFKAHRTILVARAPVLGAMFVHDTTEKASGEASIEDCEPEVFEQLLHHIYRGAPRELTAENASALYVLADKYLVNEVKALCVRCMRDTLCLDNYCDTLTLSLMHGEDELLKKATDFFSRNMVDVMKTVKWQRFMHEHTTWANEITIRGTELTVARYEVLVDRSV